MFRHFRILQLCQWRGLHVTRHRSIGIRQQSSKARRVDRITAKLPQRLQKYTKELQNAPLSHIVSFLILHEITAIIPLFGLFALFHYTTFVPVTYMTTHFGSYVESGLLRFEKYFSRKGWFGFEPKDVEKDAEFGADALGKWRSGEKRYQILVEVALAYAITKALLPLRIIGSVWATPWFAGILQRMKGTLSRKLK